MHTCLNRATHIYARTQIQTRSLTPVLLRSIGVGSRAQAHHKVKGFLSNGGVHTHAQDKLTSRLQLLLRAVEYTEGGRGWCLGEDEDEKGAEGGV